MGFGADPGIWLLSVLLVVVVFLVLDPMVAGGGMTGGMMGGMAGMMGTTWGWGLLLLVAILIVVLMAVPGAMHRARIGYRRLNASGATSTPS